MMPEFSRPVRVDTLGSAPRALSIEANDEECAGLADRLDLQAIDRLAAELTIARNGETITAEGTLKAEVTQSCVASGEPVPATIDEPFTILFRPQRTGSHADEEIELSEGEMDVVFYDGGAVDVGEAVAESLSLALPSYPRAAGAEAALREAGVRSEEDDAAERAERSPFAMLKKS